MIISDGDVFSSSVRGNVRKQNEDSCGVFDVPNGKLFVVCDGMGGHAGGATASKLGVDSIANYFQQAKYPDIKLALANALEYANLQIIDAANEMPSLKGMGTTACVLLIQGDEAWIAHCGDSRIYLYCAEQQWLHRITKDHSYVQGLVDQGLISDAEAETHPNKNRILKALGIKVGCKPTVCDEPILPANGDTFLICSDGLSGMVNDEQLQYVLQQEGTILNKGQMMIQLALQAGGLDNITTQLIRVSQSPHAHSAFISQNPKERIVPAAHQVPQNTLPTNNKKKSPKLFLKIMLPIAIVIVIACGALWIWSYLSSKPINEQETISAIYNPGVDITENVITNEVDETGTTDSSVVFGNTEKNYIIEWWEVYPNKGRHNKDSSDYVEDIEIINFCKDKNKNYKYKKTIKGQTESGEVQHIKFLYRKTINDKDPKISIDKPESTTTPSKNRVKVEKFKCNLEGQLIGGSEHIIEDIQWRYTYTEGSNSPINSDYYKSKEAVMAAANQKLSGAPDTVLCKVEWYNHSKDINGSLSNQAKYESYLSSLKTPDSIEVQIPDTTNVKSNADQPEE